MGAGTDESALFRRVVIGLEGEPGSETGTRAVADFARLFGAELVGMFTEDSCMMEWADRSPLRQISRSTARPVSSSPEQLARELSAANLSA